ncbi:MAG: 3-deoxy-D-manno-octulosonic acid transferase [Candidatus Omnitrophota bacterium]
MKRRTRGPDMFYFFYDLLIIIAALIYLPFYALRGRVHRRLFVRLGFFKNDLFKEIQGKDVIWVHAVSVGEARACESLVRLFRESWPEKKIIVSTVTPTGYELLRKILKEPELIFYAPLDISFVVNKFLSAIRPSLLVIMETEIWPNLIRLSKSRGCRVVVANGRISDNSYGGYQRIRPILAPILNDVDLFCMQTDVAVDRITALGASSERVKRTGNIKFDISSCVTESGAIARLKGLMGDSFLLIAGSTHENEEEVLLGIYASLRKDFNNLRLLIAPRHVQRVDKIRRMVKLQGLEAAYFSNLKSLNSSVVVLLDTIGDLNSLYKFCDIAFVGGSLVNKGGHNPIEPALFSKPVIFGKYMGNFKEIRDIFISEKAALEVDSAAGLEYELRRLLADEPERKALGQRARGLLDKNKGAALRTFAEIKKVVT